MDFPPSYTCDGLGSKSCLKQVRTRESPQQIPLRSTFLLLSHSALFDALYVIGALEDGIDVDTGRVDLIGRELARFDELLDFGDDVVGGGGHHGIEVARGFAEDEIAPAVALPGFDEREIATKGALQNEVAAVELACLFAVGDHGAVAGGRVKRGNARAAGAQAFGEGALRIQLHLQFAAQNKLFEQLVLANVGRNHFLNLTILQQQADSEVVYPGIVTNHSQVLGAFATHSANEIFRNAAETEATHQNRHAIAQVGDGGVSGSDAFIHGIGLSIARGEVYSKCHERGSAPNTGESVS